MGANGHGGNVVDELTADHREVEEMFHRLELSADAEERRKLAEQSTIELVRHSVAEEEYLYPAVREHLPDGDLVADKELADHAGVEKLLKEWEKTPEHEPRFSELLREISTEVRAHVDDEENRLFPSLAAHCGPDVLDDLGDKVRRAKKLAPTRPHPSAPDTPPANKLLAPGTGLVDRARDLVTGRGRS
ncbi:hemerythrin domain-containing protein [Yinghuangia sp. YIM S09857]|uniref:hemerythrin domain-containing protein n=1 Tax=Yinghuangia sp. YIM S09857 TaxID=3436929 RepID=UPI003F52A575